MSLTLYYSPGACSLADHIALKEAGLPHELVHVDLKAKTTEDGRDYREINPKGAVPALEENGQVFTENAALLIMIAERAGQLLPKECAARYRVLEAVAFITTEVHKGFAPLFKGASDADKEKAKETLSDKFSHLSQMLGEDEYVAGPSFSIADCYAIVMLLWADKMGIAVSDRLGFYRGRILSRPAVEQAMEAEGLA
ncbi:glutathione S-transferase N-terminal domain-containing protein [Pacificimonas flava]|uniref:Glutathione S-transferase n=1 Tax=Pacificimonas flava TaxID=1234595 RepID=M2U5X7_9SPHN|nr:glutathione S-transferase N-terminal domain-containing protein [Pacificimonas flava]EMD83398.1 Glutathione S-transferase [Pacificimonas flava]MBB5279040.1 glutathione S-transferase [Pacificimonas flava]